MHCFSFGQRNLESGHEVRAVGSKMNPRSESDADAPKKKEIKNKQECIENTDLIASTLILF